MTHTIELVCGYTDNKGQIHKRVTFGKRITVGDLFKLDTDPQAQDNTQYQDLIMREAITAFGTMKLPIPLPVFLSLDSIDREDLRTAHDKFLEQSRAGCEAQFLADNKVKLAFGFKIGDVVYDTVQFGKRITGYDEVEANRLGYEGVKRECFRIAKQITQLSSSLVDSTLETIEVKDFEQLDGYDLLHLRIAAELWRQSFRLAGKSLSQNAGTDSVSADEGNGAERR